jgi:hypothetical protein
MPAPHPIVPAKAVQYTDTTLDGDGFNLRDLAKDLERHDGRCRPGFPIRAIGVEGSLLGAFSPDSSMWQSKRQLDMASSDEGPSAEEQRRDVYKDVTSMPGRAANLTNQETWENGT